MRRFARRGFHVLYIGHRGHPFVHEWHLGNGQKLILGLLLD